MSIRFKFRSSSAFDSVDLNGRRSISVRDLRSKIVAQKNLQICKNFDLVISDAETDKALEDEDHEIKEGTSIVIKRVPVHCHSDVGNAVRKDEGCVDRVATAPSKNVDKENFDDFGADLYPILLGSLADDASCLGFTVDKTKVVPRCSKPSGSRCQNIERSDISEEVVGDNCSKEFDIEEISKQIKLEPKKEVHQNMDEHIVMPLSTTDMVLPTELRCSLCCAIFKEAVMIPCCQHSFCDKCIRSALAVRGRCPKCSSMNCAADALLPNVSLRQAIIHFLEAQAANNALENKIITQYVPDVESGIRVKEASSALSIQKKETPCRHSSSIRKGSNQVMAGVGCENKLTGDMGKSTHSPLKIKKMKWDGNWSAENFNHMSNFHGIHSSSMLPHNFLQEEDESGSLMLSSRYRKGYRNCYMCGSPHHLIRDCPASSNSYSFNDTGGTPFPGVMPVYGQAYWQGNTFPQAMAYMNMNGAPAMMPFNPTMGPISPLGIPLYMPSMYTGMPGPYGFMGLGSVQPPMMPGAERHLTCQAFAEPRASEQKHNNRRPESEHDFDHLPEDYYYRKNQRISREQRHQLNKENNGSFSNDDSVRIHRKRTDKKHCGSSHQRPDAQSDEELSSIELKYERGSHQSVSRRETKARHHGRTNSESQDFSDSCNLHGRERKRHCHGSCSENQRERSGLHQSLKVMSGDHTKVVTDHKKHNQMHHDHSESSFERNLYNDGRHHRKEKKASHSSRSSRKNMPNSEEDRLKYERSRSSRKNMPNSEEDRLKYERWKMVDGLDDEYRGVDQYKRRRIR